MRKQYLGYILTWRGGGGGGLRKSGPWLVMIKLVFDTYSLQGPADPVNQDVERKESVQWSPQDNFCMYHQTQEE